MITYPDSVRFLYSLGNEIRTARMGLQRISRLLEALGNPQQNCRYIHVAGTNGKGSTCAMIESALRASGMSTGLYTSPHLVEPPERIQVAGQPVSREEFVELFEQVHRAAVRLIDQGILDAHPTYFETVTAMGFLSFARSGVEIVVLEVGLGGRLDATNVITPDLCVIAPVDYDHQAWLGSTLTRIAAEKAGILKAGVPAVFAQQHPDALFVLRNVANDRGVPFTETSDWEVRGLKLHPRGSDFTAVHHATAIDVECPLAGEHQVQNALTAAVALHRLGLPPESIHRGIRQAHWPGRLERISTRPEIILDGAHNPAGVRALAAYIRRFFANRRVWLIYGAMRDKSVGEIGDILAPLASEVILTQAQSPRALSPDALVPLFDHPLVRTARHLADALTLARDADPEDVIFVTGSLFLVGEARSLLVQ